MNQQPDKLFREKLEGFHKTAPSAAWNKIEAGLQKKNNKAIWLRVAAAVLLVAVATFLIWTNQSARSIDQIAEENKKREPHVQQKTQPQAHSDKEEVTVQPQQVQPSIATNAEKKANKIRTIQPSIEKSVNKEPASLMEPAIEGLVSFTPQVDNTLDSSAIVPSIVEDLVVTGTTTQQTEEHGQPRVLVFSVEEVDAKYLDKEALAKATSSQKKSSTFRKLLNKAYDLKNNQDPFGDLRQKKNEILALNFKSEKRSQNK